MITIQHDSPAALCLKYTETHELVGVIMEVIRWGQNRLGVWNILPAQMILGDPLRQVGFVALKLGGDAPNIRNLVNTLTNYGGPQSLRSLLGAIMADEICERAWHIVSKYDPFPMIPLLKRAAA